MARPHILHLLIANLFALAAGSAVAQSVSGASFLIISAFHRRPRPSSAKVTSRPPQRRNPYVNISATARRRSFSLRHRSTHGAPPSPSKA